MVKIRTAVDEYLNEAHLKGNRASSIKTCEWALEVFVKWCDEGEITEMKQIGPDTYLRFINEAPQKSDYTKRSYAQYTRQFIRWAYACRYGITKYTVEHLPLPHIEETEVFVFTPEEIKRMRMQCKRMPYPYRSEAIVNVLLDTGVRASELCYNSKRPLENTGLRIENTYYGRGIEHPYIKVVGKGPDSGRPRNIPIGQETALSLQRYINRERGESRFPFVFLSRQDHPLGVRMLAQFLEDLGDLCSIENVHPHRFRHTFAVYQLLAGTSDLMLMRLMGHTSLESTRIYTRALENMNVLGLTPSVVDELRKRKNGNGY